MPCEVIDLTHMPVGSHPSASLRGLPRAEKIASNGIWDHAEPLDIACRERYHDLWRRLRAENAPLRVVDADGLRSAPITFFDQQLLAFGNASWQKPARIIGETMREWISAPTEPYFQAAK